MVMSGILSTGAFSVRAKVIPVESGRSRRRPWDPCLLGARPATIIAWPPLPIDPARAVAPRAEALIVRLGLSTAQAAFLCSICWLSAAALPDLIAIRRGFIA